MRNDKTLYFTNESLNMSKSSKSYCTQRHEEEKNAST